MAKIVRSLAAVAFTLTAVAACSSASSTSDGAASSIVHESGALQVRTREGGAAGVRSGAVSIRNVGCSCGDADWCNYGYPFNDTYRGFDCTENGTTYACLCDCGWDCVPVD